MNISLVDRLYSEETKEVKNYFSEYSIIRYKLLIMIEYVISLSKIDILDLNEQDINYMKDIYKNFKKEDCLKIKNSLELESYENYIIEQINKNKELEEKGVNIFINFSLIDEDIYNIVNMILIKNVNTKIQLPKISEMLGHLKKKILEWSKVAILTRVDSGIGPPSFLGKELLVFYERLVLQTRELNKINYRCKLGGSTGNFNSLHLSLPNIDWIDFGDKFVNLLGLNRNQYTTKYDHNDNYSEIFHILLRINNIILHFLNYLKQLSNINYINFNNKNFFIEYESLLLLANNTLTFLSNILPNKQYLNNFLLLNLGDIFSKIIITINSLNKFLPTLSINHNIIHNDLHNNQHITLEGIQSRLKELGIVENSSQILKQYNNNK